MYSVTTIILNFQSPKVIRLALLVVGVGAFLFQCLDYINFTVDDVFISFRYAEQVFHGHGYVYNIGEYVEGYSNWLWVTILAGVASFGLNRDTDLFAMLWSARAISFFVAVGNVVLIHRLGKKFLSESQSVLVRYIPFLLVTTSGAYSLWTMGALETQLCALFFLIAADQSIEVLRWNHTIRAFPFWRYLLIGFSWLGAMLTRPEPVLHAFAASFFIFFALQKNERWRFLLISVLPIFIVFSLFLLWRYTTYHDILPNTFYAKTYLPLNRFLLGIKYALSGIGFLTGPFLFFFALPFFQVKKLGKKFWFMSTQIALTLFFVIYSGGDWMPGYRFFIPVFGFIAIVSAVGVHLSVDALRRLGIFRKVSILALLIFLILYAGIRVSWDRVLLRGTMPTMASGLRVQRGHSLPEHYVVAEWLAHHTTGPFSVASGEAGLIGYRNMNMTLLDCNGLMDKQIARQRRYNSLFSANYILDKKLDFIILPGNVEKDVFLIGTAPEVYYSGAFLTSKRFQEKYKLVFQYFSFGVYQRYD